MTTAAEPAAWRPQKLRVRPRHVLLSWLLSAAALLLAAWILPGVSIEGFTGALVASAAIGVLNALIPPLLAALRLPATLILGFVLVLVADALIVELAAEITSGALKVSGFDQAFLAALIISAGTTALSVILGVDDDEAYSLRVTRRIAARHGGRAHTEVPGILFLEIDGLALPILRRAMQDGSAPNMASWMRSGSHELLEWETDLSSQTGASQAGILLGSNEDIPAFRWVEKESAKIMSCSSPADCAEIERRRAAGVGLLIDGGASRGNLLSGEADEQILTASRTAAEIKANPGYRSFMANGYNVTRCLVLFFWEVALELTAAAQQRRRGVLPRGHRGGRYPFLRAAMCVVLPELIVHAVLSDMMRGRPAIYATFSSYDEVAHHSGLERADTLEALRKLDRQFGRIERARAYAPRPYEIVVLSDHGQTQGATFKQRNDYGLDDLVRRSIERAGVLGMSAGDTGENIVGQALDEATGHSGADAKEPAGTAAGSRDAIVLGSGNLGLIYLMEERRRLTLEEIEARHPRLIGALCEHPHIGWLLVRSEREGALVLGRAGRRRLASGEIEGEDPLAPFSGTAARHLLRTDSFEHTADVMVGSFYDPWLEEGCAFEELISFHGGLGGPQTRPFVLHPKRLPVPAEPVIGAEAVHSLLAGWRAQLQSSSAAGSAS
ncbi:MAG TPA: phage holin family protein [Solirubrobacteraceae bacterium]